MMSRNFTEEEYEEPWCNLTALRRISRIYDVMQLRWGGGKTVHRRVDLLENVHMNICKKIQYICKKICTTLDNLMKVIWKHFKNEFAFSIWFWNEWAFRS